MVAATVRAAAAEAAAAAAAAASRGSGGSHGRSALEALDVLQVDGQVHIQRVLVAAAANALVLLVFVPSSSRRLRR